MYRLFLLFFIISTFILNIQIGFTSDSQLKICLANFLSNFSNKNEGPDSILKLQKEREELSIRLIEKIKEISGHDIVGIPEEKARIIDSIFANKLKEKIQSLDSQQLKSLEEVISRSNLTLVSKLSNGGHVKDFKKIEKMTLEMNLWYQNHPASRIIMWHEFTHVVDIINKNSLATKNLEKLAFLDQYDYIREVFKLEDLVSLKEMFPNGAPDVLINKLKDANIIVTNGLHHQINLENLMTAVQNDPNFKKVFQEYLSLHGMNSWFTNSVEDALTMNKTDFLKKQLKPYRGKIAIENIKEILQYMGVSTGAGYYIYKKHIQEEK